MSNDTVFLLKECDSGTKTAVNSIRDVLDNVKSEKLLKLLSDSLEEHERLGDRANEMLAECGSDGKEPNPMARAASWAKINVKLFDDPSDQTIASLMTDGCNMGIKQLRTYKNKYPSADKKAQKLAEELIDEENFLLEELKSYL